MSAHATPLPRLALSSLEPSRARFASVLHLSPPSHISFLSHACACLRAALDGCARLYQAKWRLYGRRVHFIRLLVECVLLASLVIQSMWLKGWPSSSMASGGPQRLAVLHLVLVAISLEEEARTFYLYARNQQGDGDTRMRLTWLLSEVWAFMLQHSVHVLVLSHLFTLGGCAMLLIPGLLPDLDCAPGTDDWFSKWYNDQPNNSSSSSGCGVDAPSPASYGSRRQLKTSSASSAYSSGEVATFSSWQIIDEGAWGGLWFAQAFSLFLLVFYLAFVLSHAIDSLNTWLRTIHRMFIRDFSTYLCALFVILTAFYLALYLLFPRSGERSLPQSLDFNECARQMRARATIPSSSRRPPRLARASQHTA
jgi:hypothetical protein